MRRDSARYSAIAQIVREDWDPIGVSPGIDAPLDEYNGYLPSIERLLAAGADVTKLSDYLCYCVRVNMGMRTDGNREINVAKLLIDKYNEF